MIRGLHHRPYSMTENELKSIYKRNQMGTLSPPRLTYNRACPKTSVHCANEPKSEGAGIEKPQSFAYCLPLILWHSSQLWPLPHHWKCPPTLNKLSFLPLFLCFSFRHCFGTQEPGITMSSLGLRSPVIPTVVYQALTLLH